MVALVVEGRRAPVAMVWHKGVADPADRDFQMREGDIEDLPMVDRPSGRLLSSQLPTGPGPIVVAAPSGRTSALPSGLVCGQPQQTIRSNTYPDLQAASRLLR